MSTTEILVEGAALLADIGAVPVVGPVATTAGIIMRAVKAAFPNADANFAAAVEEEIQQTVFREIPDLRQRIKHLESAFGAQPSLGAVGAIFESFSRAYAKTEDSKRKLLLNALRNAFDPELYKKGMTARLLALLEPLDYPDLSQLMAWEVVKTPWLDPWTAEAHHATRLVDAGLMYRAPGGALRPDNAGLTYLGEMMIALIRDPDAEV